MEETSKEIVRPPPSRAKVSKETELLLPLTLTSPTQNHISRLSPRHNGSTLYDSFELRAVTYQLNKAMHPASGSSPANLCYLKSPFYSQCLQRLSRESSRAPKRVLCSHLTCATINRKESSRTSKEVTRGFAAKLWNKLKQGVLRNIKKRNEEKDVRVNEINQN